MNPFAGRPAAVIVTAVPATTVPAAGANVGLLQATVPPLATVPLVVPEVLTGTVPELAPLIAPAVMPVLMPELMMGLSLVRPPHAAMAKSTNVTGDHRPRLRNDKAVMARRLSHRSGVRARDYVNESGRGLGAREVARPMCRAA